MASKLKKIACDVSIDDPISSTSDSDTELGSEDIDLQFSGRLSFRSSARLAGEDRDDSDLSADDEDSDTAAAKIGRGAAGKGIFRIFNSSGKGFMRTEYICYFSIQT